MVARRVLDDLASQAQFEIAGEIDAQPGRLAPRSWAGQARPGDARRSGQARQQAARPVSMSASRDVKRGLDLARLDDGIEVTAPAGDDPRHHDG